MAAFVCYVLLVKFESVPIRKHFSNLFNKPYANIISVQIKGFCNVTQNMVK